MYFDSHCHLTSERFAEDREAVLERAMDAGVTRMVTIASDVDDARQAIGLARGTPGLWCTAGVHPHAAGEAEPGAVEKVRRLATQNPEVVAIGETGLDFYYDNAPRDVQRDLFGQHLALGAELDLPVVVHARDADDEVADSLHTMPEGTRGVLHCFTGGPKAFDVARDRDWYVSFSGIASFKSFDAIDFLERVPEDRLLIETDSPYLAPVPHRGRRNEPALVVHVAEAVARILGSTVDEVAERTTRNAHDFYRIEVSAR